MGGWGEDVSQQPRRLFPMIRILKDRPIPSPAQTFPGRILPNTENFHRKSQRKKSYFLDLFPPPIRQISQTLDFSGYILWHWDSVSSVCKSLIKILFHFLQNKNSILIVLPNCSDCLLGKHQILSFESYSLPWHIAVLYFSVIWVVKSSWPTIN